MPRLTALDPAAAPQRSRELLNDIIGRSGSVGAMVSTMAHSPALLQGYLAFSRAMKRTTLPRALSEKISLAVQAWIGCEYCLAAHTDAGRAAELSETDIALARQGTATDAREATLIALALQILVEPAAITDEDLTDLRALGYSDRLIADVVGVVMLNLLTGAFNLLAGLELTPA